MPARIYQRSINAMLSGKARNDSWALEFAPSEAGKADPLLGWSGSSDTQTQVKLSFPTLGAARAYADKYGIECHIIETPLKTLKLQAYSDNFR